ncbi:hypothetical protein BGX34_003728 [Mortierella sp. NVP85]|nr:hypothetical protein BGX34_003728 [Mortierella sp. NVP85]
MPKKRESEPIETDRSTTRRRIQGDKNGLSKSSQDVEETSSVKALATTNAASELLGDDEALLLNKLTWAIYGTRPTMIQQRVVDYIFQMRVAPAPLADEYIAFVRAAKPSANASTVTTEWQFLRNFFSDQFKDRHTDIADIANIPELIAAFKKAPELDPQTVEAAWIPHPPPMAPGHLASLSSAPSSSSPHRDRPLTHRGNSSNCNSSSNNNNSNNNNIINNNNNNENNNNNNSANSANNNSTNVLSSRCSSSSNSNGSSKNLSPTQVASMQELFKTNFNKFQGDEWLLPSGASFDHVLYEAIKGMRHECPLHSFVVDSPTVIDLFADARDKDELNRVMVGRMDEKLLPLSPAETALLEVYNKDPDELEELFADKGWRAVGASLTEKTSAEYQRLVFDCLQQLFKVYRGERMTLPQAPHESWVINRLWSFLADALDSPLRVEFQPGEYHSHASMYRRNLDCARGVRQFVGHKVDGVAVAVSTKFELLVIEAAKKDGGPNVTRALDDGLKLCKLTKDMHDLIRSEATRNVRGNLVTFGIQISGEKATFLTLRQRRGRFYQLCREGCETLPAVWTDRVNTQRVLRVLAMVIMIRKTLLSMARDIAEFTTGSIDGSKLTDSSDCIAATLTSPQLIPSSPLSAESPDTLRLC